MPTHIPKGSIVYRKNDQDEFFVHEAVENPVPPVKLSGRKVLSTSGTLSGQVLVEITWSDRHAWVLSSVPREVE